VEETEPDDPDLQDVHILEAIDVKREKLSLTKEKCRFLIKSSTIYDDEERAWRVNQEARNSLHLNQVVFDGDLFVGPIPIFEKSLGPPKKAKTKVSPTSSTAKTTPNASTTIAGKSKPRKSLNGITPTTSTSTAKPLTVKRKRSKGAELKK